MFHSLVIVKAQSQELLLGRFYGPGEDQESFVDRLRSLDASEAGGVQRVALVEDGGQVVPVVYQSLGGLVFFLGGEGEACDELLCAEVLHALMDNIVAQCDRELGEDELLAQFDRITLVVDHMIRHGKLEHTDRKLVAAMVNLDPGSVNAEMLAHESLELVSNPNASVPVLKSGKTRAPKETKTAKLQNSDHRERRSESQIFVLNKKK